MRGLSAGWGRRLGGLIVGDERTGFRDDMIWEWNYGHREGEGGREGWVRSMRMGSGIPVRATKMETLLRTQNAERRAQSTKAEIKDLCRQRGDGHSRCPQRLKQYICFMARGNIR